MGNNKSNLFSAYEKFNSNGELNEELEGMNEKLVREKEQERIEKAKQENIEKVKKELGKVMHSYDKETLENKLVSALLKDHAKVVRERDELQEEIAAYDKEVDARTKMVEDRDKVIEEKREEIKILNKIVNTKNKTIENMKKKHDNLYNTYDKTCAKNNDLLQIIKLKQENTERMKEELNKKTEESEYWKAMHEKLRKENKQQDEKVTHTEESLVKDYKLLQNAYAEELFKNKIRDTASREYGKQNVEFADGLVRAKEIWGEAKVEAGGKW